jgi:2-oxoglutarate dehydrogenase E2 component (dihydrolipoamide succinyltransferase)
MGTQIIVPNLGESIIEATIAHWFKKAGDRIEVGEPLVELETDKVNLEVGAEQAGILAEIKHAEGDDVKVGEILGSIEDAASQPRPSSANGNQSEQASQEVQAVASPPVDLTAAPPAPETKEPHASEEKATPVARRVAQEQGINLSEIHGSGPGGRVTRQDIENFVEVKPAPQVPETAAPASRSIPEAPLAMPITVPGRLEERVKMSRRRRTIAQRLVEAQHTAAMLTTFNDVDMGAIMEIRQRRKQPFKDKYGVSLGIVSFFVKASILALKDFPQVNAEIQGDEVILKHYYDIGVAIGAQEGLVVPVLRNAEQMSFAQIEKGIQGFAQKTRDNTLSLEDLRGGTFTITNGGVFGSLLSTPILNSPQVAILGLHRIDDRPVVKNGEIIVRPMMYVALSYDHRMIDGREAVQFLVRIKETIENPEMILLES